MAKHRREDLPPSVRIRVMPADTNHVRSCEADFDAPIYMTADFESPTSAVAPAPAAQRRPVRLVAASLSEPRFDVVSVSSQTVRSTRSVPPLEILRLHGWHGPNRRRAVDGATLGDMTNQGWADNAIVNTMSNDELSVLRRAQDLVRQHDDEARAKRLEREGQVRQTAALIETYSSDCSKQLAELLEISQSDHPVSSMKWRLSESGEKLISFNPEDNDLLVDMHRMPMLVTNFEGYAVGAQHLLGTDVYLFGLTCGGENWSGFDDLESFGRATMQSTSGRFKWGEVKLSQYNE